MSQEENAVSSRVLEKQHGAPTAVWISGGFMDLVLVKYILYNKCTSALIRSLNPCVGISSLFSIAGCQSKIVGKLHWVQ